VQHHRRFLALLLAVLALVAAACGGGGGDGEAQQADNDRQENNQADADSPIAVQVASYELVANREQRFIVGAVGNSEPGLLSFGTVELAFSYMGTKERPAQPPVPGPKGVTADFRPLPGQKIDASAPGPKLVEPSQGVGVYAADDVRFDQAGFWQVELTAQRVGESKPDRASATFEVVAEPRLPAVGDPAPRTANPLPGAPGIDLAAIDSRARGGEPLPDPELHSVSIADSIEQGRAVLVTISTPVYCQSRFCGPITDSVQELAHRYAGKLDFVHLEVWEDFEAKKINPFVRDWIVPKAGSGGEGANEPWTYLVGRDGRIAARWDNVATEAEMVAAIERATAG
jgi:hypothetical protein